MAIAFATIIMRYVVDAIVIKIRTIDIIIIIIIIRVAFVASVLCVLFRGSVLQRFDG